MVVAGLSACLVLAGLVAAFWLSYFPHPHSYFPCWAFAESSRRNLKATNRTVITYRQITCYDKPVASLRTQKQGIHNAVILFDVVVRYPIALIVWNHLPAVWTGCEFIARKNETHGLTFLAAMYPLISMPCFMAKIAFADFMFAASMCSPLPVPRKYTQNMMTFFQ